MPPRKQSASSKSSSSSRKSRSSSGSSRSSKSQSSQGRRRSTAEPLVAEQIRAALGESGTGVGGPALDGLGASECGKCVLELHAVTVATTTDASRAAQRDSSGRRLSVLRSASLLRYGSVGRARSVAREEVKFSTGERQSALATLHSWKPLIFKVALFGGLFLAALTLVVILLAVLSQWHGPASTESPTTPRSYLLCETADCVAHAAALHVGDASAGSACVDFGRFVCSSWNRRVAIAASLTEQLVMESLLALSRTKVNGSSLKDRPAEFMGLCKTTRPDKDSAGVDAFKQFLRNEANFLNRGTATYTTLLEALTVLSGTWLVPLWFQFDLVAATANSRFITIKPEPLVPFWRKVHGTLKAYTGYVEQFIRVVYDNGTASVPASYLEFLRTQSGEVQTKVLKWMSVVETEHHPMPVSGSLSDLSEFAPKFTGAAWASAASKVLGFNVGEHYVVYVSSSALLDAMNVVTKGLSAQQLLYHTVWWFVQQIGALSSNSLFQTTTFALGESSTLYEELLCGIQVSITYNTLIASQHVVSFSDDERQYVEETLNAVHSETVKIVRSSQTLGQPQRDWISYMLVETQPVVWPLPPHFEPKDLPRLYGQGADNTRGFFGHWRSSRQALAKDIGSASRSAAAKFYRVDPTTLTSYEPTLKEVAVATAALRGPLFYGGGTEAMRYGGLGFTYADRLVRSMNVRSLLHAAAFALLPVADLKDRLLEGMLCSDRTEKLKAFPYLPALALAYAAYNKSVNSTSEPRLKGLEEYTGQQVFFMTACLSLCEEDASGRRHSPACSAAARNFAPFAEAFNCPLGSPMNRRDKCSILTS